jgi:hypothetical protein
MKYTLIGLFGISLACATDFSFAQSANFSYSFSLRGITEILSAQVRDNNLNWNNYDTTYDVGLSIYDSLTSSTSITDTTTVSYHQKDALGNEYEEYTLSLTFTIDTVNKILPSFLYTDSSDGRHMRYGGSGVLSIHMINIPFLRNSDGSISVFLTKADVITHIYNITYNSWAWGVNTNTGTETETLKSLQYDTSNMVLRISLGKPHQQNKVYIFDKNKLSFFPSPISHSLHIYFTDPLKENNELYIYDILGRKVKTISTPPSSQNFDISITDLPDGPYFVKFGFDTYRIIVSK